MRTRRLWLEDRVCRALGLLRSARLLGSEEAMEALGLVRLGQSLGIVAGRAEGRATPGVPAGLRAQVGGEPAGTPRIDGGEVVDAGAVAALMLSTQPAHLQAAAGRELTQAERRAARAALARAVLAGRSVAGQAAPSRTGFSSTGVPRAEP
jgi:protein arginine kinase